MAEPTPSDDLSAIRERVASWFGALGRGDAAAAVELVSEEVVWLPPQGPAIEGKGALESALVQFLSSATERIAFDILEAEVSGGLGFARVRERSRITLHDRGETHDVAGQHLFLFKAARPGEWRISHQVSRLERQSVVG